MVYINIEDMIKNMTPQMLSNALGKMSKMLSPEQMQEVEKAIKGTNKGELDKKLNNLSTADLQAELSKNPNLAKQLASNPEIMKKINAMLKK